MTLLQEDYMPRYVGDLEPSLQHQFVDHNGMVYQLTDVTLGDMVIVFKNTNTGVRKVGKGTWTYVNAGEAAEGIAWYNWHADDVADAGVFAMQVGIPFGATLQHFEIRLIEFLLPL